MAKEAIPHPIRTRGYPTAGKASAWQAKKVKVCVLNKNTAADQVGNLTCRLSAPRFVTSCSLEEREYTHATLLCDHARAGSARA